MALTEPDPMEIARELARSHRISSQPEYLRAILVVLLAIHDRPTPDAIPDPGEPKARKGGKVS